MSDTAIYSEIVITALAVDEVQQDLVAHDLGACRPIECEVIPMRSGIIGCGSVGIVAVHVHVDSMVQRDDASGRTYGPAHRESGYPIVELDGFAGWRGEGRQPRCGCGRVNSSIRIGI